MAFDWESVDARIRAILASPIARVKERFPDVLIATHSAFPASASEHFNLYVRFAFEIDAEENDALVLILSCSRAISQRPREVRPHSQGSQECDWIDFAIEDEGGNDFARIETRLLPGNAAFASPAYEQAIASYLDDLDVFLGEHISLILERLAFQRLLKDH